MRFWFYEGMPLEFIKIALINGGMEEQLPLVIRYHFITSHEGERIFQVIAKNYVHESHNMHVFL